MSESGDDYDPGPWKGYDYVSARKAYVPDITAGRGYSTSYDKSKGTSPDILPANITTNSKSPLVILVDGTGSMGQFPEIIFEKLPLLDDGVKDYLGDDCEISYAMIGDVTDAVPPLQVRPFGRGKQMVDSLNKLVIGRGGGSNQVESYELGALYYSRNVEMPNATTPILIYICDEGLYPTVDIEWAKRYANVSIRESISIEKLFDELKSKYNIYCIRKHYDDGTKYVDGDQMCGANLNIHNQWARLIGDDHIVVLNEARRVVDVILGLLANETGKMSFFKKELTDRQTPDQVKSVMKAMITVGRGPAHSGKSVMKRPDDGNTKASKSLI